MYVSKTSIMILTPNIVSAIAIVLVIYRASVNILLHRSVALVHNQPEAMRERQSPLTFKGRFRLITSLVCKSSSRDT